MEIKNKLSAYFRNLEPQFKNTAAVLFFIIFWAGLYIYTESFPSGYQLGDDLEIVKYQQTIKQNGSIKTIKDYVLQDIMNVHRYRPLFSLQRAAAICMFDLNLSLYLAFIGILAVITSYFLYKFCFTIGFSFWQSVFFGIISLIGNASVIWIEVDDAENTGMFFLSITLYFLAKSIYAERNKNIYKTGFIFFLICMTASKESFIFIVPAILFLYLWLYSLKNNQGILQTIKKNFFTSFTVLFIFAVTLIAIKLFILDKAPRYSGIDSKVFSISGLIGFFQVMSKLRITYLILIGILIMIIFRIAKRKLLTDKSFFAAIKVDFLNIMILFLLITVPQYLNYYKSSFLDRYYTPYIIGFSIFLIFLYNKIITEKYMPKLVKLIFTILLIYFVFLELKIKTIPEFKHSSMNQNTCDIFINSISDKVNSDSTMMVVVDPVQHNQAGFALVLYLKEIEKFRKVNINFSKKDDIPAVYADTAFYNYMKEVGTSMFKKESYDSLKSKDEINGIALLWGVEDNFIKENKSWFKPENFYREEFGIYRLYTKK